MGKYVFHLSVSVNIFDLSLFVQQKGNLKGQFIQKMKIQSLSTHTHTDGRVGEVFLVHKTLLVFQRKKLSLGLLCMSSMEAFYSLFFILLMFESWSLFASIVWEITENVFPLNTNSVL